MAVLWIHDDLEQRWCPVPLNGKAVTLTDDPERPAVEEVSARSPMVVLPVGPGADRVLLARAGAAVWVNGDPLLLGIRVLRDRDVIRIGARESCVVFSAESLPQVVPFDQQQPTPCARCKTDIERGAPVVRCPKCSAWHDQSKDLPCWTNTDKCAMCGHPTAMDGQYQWSPEGL
jgi:hypothetical protein